jgi:hypothetical protein
MHQMMHFTKILAFFDTGKLFRFMLTVVFLEPREGLLEVILLKKSLSWCADNV